jgi:hypothetical protein
LHSLDLKVMENLTVWMMVYIAAASPPVSETARR